MMYYSFYLKSMLVETFRLNIISISCTIPTIYCCSQTDINPLNPELNPICYLLTLLELTIFSTLAG